MGRCSMSSCWMGRANECCLLWAPASLCPKVLILCSRNLPGHNTGKLTPLGSPSINGRGWKINTPTCSLRDGHANLCCSGSQSPSGIPFGFPQWGLLASSLFLAPTPCCLTSSPPTGASWGHFLNYALALQSPSKAVFVEGAKLRKGINRSRPVGRWRGLEFPWGKEKAGRTINSGVTWPDVSFTSWLWCCTENPHEGGEWKGTQGSWRRRWQSWWERIMVWV